MPNELWLASVPVLVTAMDQLPHARMDITIMPRTPAHLTATTVLTGSLVVYS